MSWLFSRALVEAFSEDTCLVGAPSVPSNENPTPPLFLPPDKMTDFSRLSRFGMTFAPLTERHGADVLTWFLEGFPARTSVPQARVPGSTERDQDCGSKWPASLTKYDPSSSSWRTAPCSHPEDSVEFSETWPRWGTMLSGECWQRDTLARPISGSEFGFWPTPTAVTASGGAALCKWGGSGARAKLRKMVSSKELNGPLNPEWVSWLMGWPQGWSSLRPLATAKYLRWQQQHSASSQVAANDNYDNDADWDAWRAYVLS
ncbi:hypothetical protein BLJAPNOD_01935 [Ensifer sp. M14]|nr:hypothetical protein BLJAPNOD_01935 [Ensifer sp. M14]